MIYTRVGFELTIEQGFQSTVRYVQSTFRSFRKSVLYLLDITCDDECNRWCTIDCQPRSSSSEPVPDRLPEPPEMEESPAAAAPAAVQLLPVGRTELPTTHRKACWDVEEEETRCLNGGSCFAIELHSGMRRSGCSCGPRWTGERCEMRYIDPSLWADAYDSSYRAASISVEIGLLIIASFLLLSVGSLILRHQKRRSLFRISTGGRLPLVKSGQPVESSQLVTNGQFFSTECVISDCYISSIADSLQKSNLTDANVITKQALGGWQWVDESILLHHSTPTRSPLLPHPTKDSRAVVVQDAPSCARQPSPGVAPQPDRSAIVLIVVQAAADDELVT